MTTINNTLSAALTQVFKVSVPSGISGMYATSIDLYFRKKSKSFGVEVTIVELANGQPDMSKVVSNSTVRVSSEDITVSEDASVATKFSFPQPVFLAADARYAFVVRALGGSPDYELWTGVNGAKDIRNGRSISSNPLSESAYFAKTTSDWAEIPNEDLKYTIYRAKFNVGNASKAVLKKGASEILQLKNVRYATGAPEFRAGDEVFGIGTNGLRQTNVYAKVTGYDPVNNYLYLNDSTGQFAVDANIVIIRSSYEGAVKDATAVDGVLAQASVSSIYDFPAHALVPKIGNSTKSLGSVTFEYRGTYKQGTPLVPVRESADSDWKPVINQEESDFYDKTRYLLSRSNEVAQLSGNSSVELRGSLSSNTDFISPMLDLRERSLVAIRNLINADSSNEHGDYGSALTRYITKTITLADGQEAEDLKVFITAYKPPRTNVLVYAKVWNQEDSDAFDKKVWTLMKQVTEPTLYSDPKNVEDYREYEFDMPALPPVTGAAYTADSSTPVQYVTSNGIFVGFKQYAIKVVMTVQSDDDAYNYPRLSDVRAIALQK